MRSERRHHVWLSSLVAFGLCVASAHAAERLVILSPHWEGIRIEFARAFAEWHKAKVGTDVEIDWRDLGGTSDDLKFVISEFKQQPAGIGIDLFFGGGIDPFYDMAKRSLLATFRPPAAVLEKVPAQIGGVPLYDPEFRWFGVALSSFGILYNKRILDARHWPVLETWRDLAERAPVGTVGSADPRSSGSTHMVYELILQRYGWDDGWAIITQLAAKIRDFDRAATTTAKDVSMGNSAYALTIDFYALTQIAYAGQDNLGFALPRDCVVINPDGLAILRGAPHLTLAQRFVEFALSEPGQQLLMLPRGQPGGARQFSIERMSILPDLYDRDRGVTLVSINPFAQPISFQYDPRVGAARWDLVNGMIGATIIDVHPELVAAWQRSATPVTGFGKPPISEADAMRLAAADWREASFRQRKLIEWQRWAGEKFRARP